MPIAASSNQKDRPPVPAGTYQGVTYGVVDLGTQPPPANSPYPARRKVLIMWELPKCRAEFEETIPAAEGQPEGKRKVNKARVVSKKFTLSLSKNSNLRPFLVGWRGKAFTAEELKSFPMERLIGVNALLAITHEAGKGQNAGKVFADVQSASKLMDGMVALKPENQPLYFSLSDCTEGEVVFPKNMPSWVQKMVMDSNEFIVMQQKHGVTQDAPASDRAGVPHNSAEAANLDPEAQAGFEADGAPF